MILLPYFECVLSNLFEKEDLAFVGCCKKILLFIPSMGRNSTSFWKSFYFLQRFKGVLFHPKESNRASSTQTDEMTIPRADRESISIFQRQRTFRKRFVLEAIDKKQLIMRLSEYSTLHIDDFTINFGSEGEKYINLTCPLFSLS